MLQARPSWRFVPFALPVVLALGCAAGGDGDGDFDGNGVVPPPIDSGAGAMDSARGLPEGAPPLSDGGSRDTGSNADSESTDTGAVDGGKADTGAAMDTGAKDSGAPTDTGPIDTGPVDTGPKDTGAKDTGADTSTCEAVTLNSGANDGGSCPAPVVDTCAMGDVAGFTNTWVPPSGLHQGLCTPTAMDDVYTGCLASGATAKSCNTAATTYADCYDCVITFEGMSSTYGPLIDTNNDLVEINVAGCIALLEPCNLTCAEEVQAASECENAACESNCPISTTASVTAFDTCEDTAASCDPNGCDTFATQATCADALTGAGHPASICVATYSTFADYYDAVVPVFCGL